MTDYKIPWDDTLGQLGSRRIWRGGLWEEPTWRDNFTFDAILTLDGMAWSYRSAVHWRAEDGAVFTMFITDFEKMLLSGRSIINKKVKGKWTFIKRGQEYGLRDAEAPK